MEPQEIEDLSKFSVLKFLRNEEQRKYSCETAYDEKREAVKSFVMNICGTDVNAGGSYINHCRSDDIRKPFLSGYVGSVVVLKLKAGIYVWHHDECKLKFPGKLQAHKENVRKAQSHKNKAYDPAGDPSGYEPYDKVKDQLTCEEAGNEPHFIVLAVYLQEEFKKVLYDVTGKSAEGPKEKQPYGSEDKKRNNEPFYFSYDEFLKGTLYRKSIPRRNKKHIQEKGCKEAAGGSVGITVAQHNEKDADALHDIKP